MRRVIFILFVGSVMLVACNKNKDDTQDPTNVAELVPGSGMNLSTGQQHTKKQLATGDMREILLSLQMVHFGLDSSTLVREARDALDDASAKLKDYPEVQVRVEGHTDERGTTEHNIALGERRASSVVKYLTEHGVSDKQLDIISLGEEKPRAMGSGVRELAENRRVEFQLVKGDIEFVLEDSTLVDDQGNPLSDEMASAEEVESSNNPDDQAKNAKALIEADSVAKAPTGDKEASQAPAAKEDAPKK